MSSKHILSKCFLRVFFCKVAVALKYVAQLDTGLFIKRYICGESVKEDINIYLNYQNDEKATSEDSMSSLVSPLCLTRE